jgi:GTP-binding protein
LPHEDTAHQQRDKCYLAAMIIKTAEFKVSNTDPGKAPEGKRQEFAFIGRSNVGKSSLINMLVNQKGLAKTSSTPGKTQTINHFLVNDDWYLVDLPGYGYASVSKTKHQAWSPMIETFLKKRTTLTTTFILIDARLDPQKIDVEFIQWMGEEGLPFALVFTKADKISKNELVVTRKKWETKLAETWEEFPPMFMTSAEERRGRDELLAYIKSLLTSH